ncbi:MAG TPA: TetR/AcrR family transcriptional regulator [Thermoanaerobaculia bacterium]|jgi:AcrR family transcriptional regulator|nr:TetR/AcrR family transcriptional regulator [Thermoanaerobaculia bacterium]HPA52234.1 TetR/AcrR family transcriptional regulator [Thermoanaerobaculia bacterium]HQN08272.1 TetR/AcrR family transcriptional regulator [Thermoanaerobaculia bacterium]HQP86994.1 TetR/AcrR family transcriptional regulator [Thermoanaerobaculia bacterium]
MGTTERREREKERVRGRILDAARELFARDGYDAVTMRKIAEAVEYSPTAIYLHFKDKESLVRELCIADFDSLARSFQRIAREPDPLERLRKAGLAYADFAVEHPNHYRLMFMTPHPEGTKDDPSAAGRKGNPEADAYAFLVATVREAIEKDLLRPDLKDPNLVAQAAWAGVHGVVSLHLAKAHDAWVDWRPLKKTVALVVDAFTRGVAKEG